MVEFASAAPLIVIPEDPLVPIRPRASRRRTNGRLAPERAAGTGRGKRVIAPQPGHPEVIARRTCAAGVQAPGCAPASLNAASFPHYASPSARRQARRRTTGGGRPEPASWDTVFGEFARAARPA